MNEKGVTNRKMDKHKQCRYCVHHYTACSVKDEGNLYKFHCELDADKHIRLDDVCEKFKRNDKYINFLRKVNRIKNENSSK